MFVPLLSLLFVLVLLIFFILLFFPIFSSSPSSSSSLFTFRLFHCLPNRVLRLIQRRDCLAPRFRLALDSPQDMLRCRHYRCCGVSRHSRLALGRMNELRGGKRGGESRGGRMRRKRRKMERGD